MAMRLNSLSFPKKCRHFVHPLVDRGRLCAARILGDNDLGTAGVELGDNGVAIERLVGDQRVEGHSLDARRHADRVEALSRQKHEAHEIAERIGERKDLVVMPPFERPIAWL
jgi:hypothetical protein